MQRLGPENYAARLARENRRLQRRKRRWSVDDLITLLLRWTRLAARGRRNLLDLRLEEQTWVLPSLPSTLSGLRLLQLSDLHLDLAPELPETIRRAVAAVPRPIHATVITGDFSQWKRRDFGPALRNILRLLPEWPQPVFAILGNHDRLQIVPPLESAGIRFLLNESVPLVPADREPPGLWLAGVDDPSFFRTHNFPKALEGTPPSAVKILLCHSPEAAPAAARFGFALCLCGHTHGGQICLPGGRPVVLPTKNLPHALVKGRWLVGAMQGYTSRGTGSCGVAARFHCSPEITLHTLQSASER